MLYYTAPTLRGWTHLLFFEVSLVVGHGTDRSRAWCDGDLRRGDLRRHPQRTVRRQRALPSRQVAAGGPAGMLQRADQVMILLLIAGSATPAFLLAVTGRAGVTGLCVLWALALTAAACRIVWLNAPPRLVGAVYLGLGWIAGLALPAVWIRFGVAPVVLLTTGGVLYTVGALVYYRRRPDPIPAVFGYHEVFHAFVCAAATCQFLATALFIVYRSTARPVSAG